MRPSAPATLLALLLAASPAAAGVVTVPDILATPEGNSGASVSAGASVSPGLGPSPVAPLAAPLSQPAALAPAAVGLIAPAAAAQIGAQPFVLPSAEAPAPAPVRARTAPHIVFDVRGSRGGNGDVAAAYLTASDLFVRTRGRDDAFVPTVTFVAGEIERRILSRLAGKEIGDGGLMFDGAARVVEATLPAQHEPADVLMNLAAHDGEFDRHGHIPVKENGIIVTQTVFGNTESARKGPGTILVGGKRLELSTAGLAKKDAGVYADVVARALRGRPHAEIGEFVLAAAEEADVKGSAAIAAILKKEVLGGADVGLAYGIGMAAVKPQFERYVSGLVARANKERKSTVVVTPSAFEISDIKNDDLRKRVVVFDGDVPLPEVAQPGTVYILKTGTLPHALFVGLMAYSRPPPLLAGDGAMSAAVGLGRPFVMTQVPWNVENMKAYAERLAARAPQNKRALIADVYLGLKLERAGELETIAPSYAATSKALPLLTDTLFSAVQAARDFHDDVPTADILRGIDDEVLKTSLVIQRSLQGDPDAREIAFEILRSGSARSRGLLVGALNRDLAGRFAFLRPLMRIDFMPLNAMAARLALTFVGIVERRAAARPARPRP